ncbi:hypothetical protein [Streptomyces sp. CB01881]|uniref:hypothetical protein n=1 Tax=Streptomyces sp. CB01881 TaxID=2078691 RepID=UPI000CDC45C1|nr:hypothetical protein [Streptomyces sp. CB01881]AUY50190.1 hypothetical protein C2142_16060 [Streptomyces sp. CB01881]TYC73583.1 hypothetical protein EH183_16040 [Streptomyces sp. CB01881]
MAAKTGGWIGEAVPGARRRPGIRRALVWGIGVCLAFTVVAVGWIAQVMMATVHPPETDADRAEKLATLHYRQHPGKGRYYVPAEAVFGRLPDGTRAGYLHYQVQAGPDSNVDDFLRVYDLPQPGAPVPLPDDLRAAFPGEEPAEAPLVRQAGTDKRQIFVVTAAAGSPQGADIYVRATG